MSTMNRQKVLLAISLVSRIGTGVVMLLFLARGLGPENYGFVVTVFAYAQLIALLTDFGFGIQALRDIGAEPHRAGVIISGCLRVKNILVAIASVLALAVLLSLQLPPELAMSCILLYASTIVLSYGDLALIVFRGIGKYGYEAAIVVAGTVLFALVVGATSFFFPEILFISIALLAARLAQTVAALICVSRVVALESVFIAPAGEVWRFAKSSSGLAVDTVLTVLSSQLDIVFVSSMLGLEAAGLYQIASRMSGYLLLPAQVLAGVYVPALAAGYKAGESGRALRRRMQIEFVVVGVVLGALLAGSMPTIAPLLFGHEYIVPVDVWISFGFLVAVRFIAASAGVALVALRGVRYRIVGQSLGVAIVTIGMWVLLQKIGLMAAPLVMIVSNIATFFVYIVSLSILQRAVTSRGAVGRP